VHPVHSNGTAPRLISPMSQSLFIGLKKSSKQKMVENCLYKIITSDLQQQQQQQQQQ